MEATNALAFIAIVRIGRIFAWVAVVELWPRKRG